jgi:putative CocE/NonD family hydrolase
LRAIIPEKTGFPARGGFMLDSIMVAWTAGQAMDWVQKAMLRQEAGQEELDIIQQALKNPQKTAQYLPLNDMPLRKIGALPSFQEMIDLFHQENGIDVASIEVPALVVTGWYDMATPETAEIYRVLRNRKSGKGLNDEVNYLAGPWDHNTTASAVGEKFFSPFANFKLGGVPGLYLDFYDRHLKGDTSKPALGARYFVMGANEWRTAPSWPPASRVQTMYCRSGGSANGAAGDGKLSTSAPPTEMTADRYRYDPLDPVPSIGGRYYEVGGSRPGPYDQRRVEGRKDVLVYTSDPLAFPLEVIGGVKVRIFMSCSTPDTDLVVKLCDVEPDGASYNILDEFLRCRWRDGFDKTALFKPGEVYEFDVDLGPVAHRFDAKHRVRLQITSSGFPYFDRNMNTGNPIGSDAKGPVAEVTVFHDAKRPTSVELPVVSSPD